MISTYVHVDVYKSSKHELKSLFIESQGSCVNMNRAHVGQPYRKQTLKMIHSYKSIRFNYLPEKLTRLDKYSNLTTQHCPWVHTSAGENRYGLHYNY